MKKQVAIIGGGITGLAAAQHFHEQAPDTKFILIEASHRLGGVIKTTPNRGFLIEQAADNFMTKPPVVVQLCERMGLGDQLIGTRPKGRGAMVVRNGRLRPIPPGFLVMAPSRLGPLFKTPILSPLGKLRAAFEYFVRRKTDNQDESLQSFISRRFGNQLFERLVQPLVGGIYTADPTRLSVAATMPRFLEMERQHGSLIRAMMKQRKRGKPPEQTSGARYGQFAALRGGMSTLIESLQNSLPPESIKLDTPVRRIDPIPHHRWSIQLGDHRNDILEVDNVIVAAPGRHAANMLSHVDSQISNCLNEIEYSSCAIISLAYRREQIGVPLNSFGFVVPLIENRGILSCSFSSLKYEGRAPEGTILVRAYLGGACQSELLKKSDPDLFEIAKSELTSLLKITGEPLIQNLTRQTDAMPQYHLGHLERVAKIEERLRLFPNLALAGKSLYGVGVPACITSGQQAAKRILQNLKHNSKQRETLTPNPAR